MLTGYMSRRGSPDAWGITLRSPDGRYGELPTHSELYEFLRQGADLVMSTESEGHICGSSAPISVLTNKETSARFIVLSLCGVSWLISQNMHRNAFSEIVITLLTDFVFPEKATNTQMDAQQPKKSRMLKIGA